MFHLHSKERHARKFISIALSFFLYLVMLPVVSSKPAVTPAKGIKAGSTMQDPGPVLPNIPVIPPGSAYRQTNFVSDIPGLAPVLDPLLVNPWGISMTASSPFWIANSASSTSTLYRGDVSGSPLVKNTSLAGITIPGQLPTGTVANPSTTDFVLPGACAAPPCAARFLFASITGNIIGWNPNAPAAGSTTGVIAASFPLESYTGLTVNNNGANKLYAADFKNGLVAIFNTSFGQQTVPGLFADPTIPVGYHPFNVQSVGTKIYVTYALYDPMTGEDVEGVGNGYVRRFDANGNKDASFAINGSNLVPLVPLNSPWGVAVAPADFGLFSGALLIGNFGEGGPSVNAFNVTTGAYLGPLQDESGTEIEIDELWALQVGNGDVAGDLGGDPNTVYFTAGTAEEQHGLFGSLKQTTVSATSLIQFATDDFAIAENAGHIDVTVTRAGDASGTATVNFNTFDEAAAGHASQKSDYEIALTKLTFNPGETSKTVRILIVDDKDFSPFPGGNEGDETIDLALSNASGAGVGLGSPNTAELTIIDDDAVVPTTNPIDDAQFFVRQHYLDFLNREPDAAGLAFWTSQITSCPDAACRELRRINVSAAFFLSIEFQQTGLQAYLTNRAAFGTLSPTTVIPVLYGTFERDTQALQKDYVFGNPGAAAQLEANLQAYYNDFVQRPQFISKYPASLSNADYVDNLLAAAGLSPSNFVVPLTNAQENPPTNPTTSGGARRSASYGTATFSLNAAETAMTFNATINNLDFTGTQTAGDTNDNLTNAHIHAGAAVTPTTNGPVVWGFIGTPLNDTNPADVVVTPFVGGVGGTVSGKWDTPEGNATTLTAQVANLKEGRAYINFHTTQFGGGEIRGQFPAMKAFRDPLVAGLDGATETRATVLRKVAESSYLKQREFNAAFVFMEYAGYLRRDADAAGFTFWLNKLNDFSGNFVNAEMVKAFIASSEYRQRFGTN